MEERPFKLPLWIVMTLTSGAGSVAAVRWASPLALDEPLVAALVFFVIPGLVIGAATWVHRIAGVAAACAAPLLWTSATVDGADPFELWLIPAATVLLLFLWSRSLSRRRHTRGVTLAVALLLAIVSLAYPRPGPPREGTRVLVVGVDGGTWDLIDPLLEQGRMPELARRMTGAARADLRSLPSMFSPQVWNTIATGYRPEVHGIWDFAGVQNDLQAGRIWDQLRLEGRSFGLFGWYCTWPPEPGDP
ncbi:MAG: hypothetical protein GF330_02980, partial [Candidatus Eisenbacteria bacterium]|nr:hypothetical protein [Candidatus Eisenbacteria bacterium]